MRLVVSHQGSLPDLSAVTIGARKAVSGHPAAGTALCRAGAGLVLGPLQAVEFAGSRARCLRHAIQIFGDPFKASGQIQPMMTLLPVLTKRAD